MQRRLCTCWLSAPISILRLWYLSCLPCLPPVYHTDHDLLSGRKLPVIRRVPRWRCWGRRLSAMTKSAIISGPGCYWYSCQTSASPSVWWGMLPDGGASRCRSTMPLPALSGPLSWRWRRGLCSATPRSCRPPRCSGACWCGRRVVGQLLYVEPGATQVDAGTLGHCEYRTMSPPGCWLTLPSGKEQPHWPSFISGALRSWPRCGSIAAGSPAPDKRQMIAGGSAQSE